MNQTLPANTKSYIHLGGPLNRAGSRSPSPGPRASYPTQMTCPSHASSRVNSPPENLMIVGRSISPNSVSPIPFSPNSIQQITQSNAPALSFNRSINPTHVEKRVVVSSEAVKLSQPVESREYHYTTPNHSQNPSAFNRIVHQVPANQLNRGEPTEKSIREEIDS